MKSLVTCLFAMERYDRIRPNIIAAYRPSPHYAAQLRAQADYSMYLDHLDREHGMSLPDLHYSPYFAMHEAPRQDDPQLVRYCLRLNVNPNALDDRDYTAMHYAAGLGKLEIVRILHEAGASLDVLSPSNKTALDYATHNKHADVEAYLVRNGALNGRDALEAKKRRDARERAERRRREEREEARERARAEEQALREMEKKMRWHRILRFLCCMRRQRVGVYESK